MKKIAFMTLAASLLAANSLYGQHFSAGFNVQQNSGTAFLDVDNIYSPNSGVPSMKLLGTTSTANYNVDAFSFASLAINPNSLPPNRFFEFSVTGSSTGALASAVNWQASTNEAHSDIFRSTGSGSNIVLYDGNGSISGLNEVGIAEPSGSAPGIDGYDGMRQLPFSSDYAANHSIYWSVDSTAITGPYAPGQAADVFVATANHTFANSPSLFAGATAIGLTTNDDIDALEVFDGGAIGEFDTGDTILFSLTPNSPTLAALGFSAADVLAFNAGDTGPSLFASASSLGLKADDDLNALSVRTIPEPGSAVLFAAIGLLGLAGCRRRRGNEAESRR